MSEQPDRPRGKHEFKLVLTPVRLNVSARPGLHQRAQVTGAHEEHACYLDNSDRSTQSPHSQIMCCCHDVDRTTNPTATDWHDQQKTESHKKLSIRLQT